MKKEDIIPVDQPTEKQLAKQTDSIREMFEKSAKFLGLRVPLSHKKIAQLVERLIKKNGFKESRIRMTLTRGENGYDFGEAKKPTFLIHAVRLKIEPKWVYESGVKVVTVKLERVMPLAKSVSLLPLVLGNRMKQGKNVYEAIFVGEDQYV